MLMASKLKEMKTGILVDAYRLIKMRHLRYRIRSAEAGRGLFPNFPEATRKRILDCFGHVGWLRVAMQHLSSSKSKFQGRDKIFSQSDWTFCGGGGGWWGEFNLFLVLRLQGFEEEGFIRITAAIFQRLSYTQVFKENYSKNSGTGKINLKMQASRTLPS